MDDVPNSEHFTLSPIGHMVSDYPDKFGIPRQPGLAPAANSKLVRRAWSRRLQPPVAKLYISSKPATLVAAGEATTLGR